MIGMAYAHPARAVLFRLLHGDLICLRSDDQAQAVVPIYSRHADFFPDNFDVGLGIDSPQREHIEVGVKPRHAVGVDASQIAFGQHIGSLFGIGFRYAEVDEDLTRKLFQVLNRENVGCLFFSHLTPYSARSLSFQGARCLCKRSTAPLRITPSRARKMTGTKNLS